jgi:biotin synthase
VNRKELLALSESIAEGIQPDDETYRSLASLPESHLFTLLAGADLIRERFFGKTIHLCTICNGKSGVCSEDCAFCAQSITAETNAPVYPLLEAKQLSEGGLRAAQTPIDRYSIVTSGRKASRSEVSEIAEALAVIEGKDIALCASLGILDEPDFNILKRAGVSRYHHNLETAESHFSSICTTHSYQQRVDTIIAARKAGLSVCAGGIFGMGETDAQVIELACALKNLDVEAVPINFLVPIKGTRLEQSKPITPLRCLKIIAMVRFVLPKKDILICGGRESALKDLHPLVFHAGANGIMTNDYLTTSGRSLNEDLKMLKQMGFITRKSF